MHKEIISHKFLLSENPKATIHTAWFRLSLLSYSTSLFVPICNNSDKKIKGKWVGLFVLITAVQCTHS